MKNNITLAHDHIAMSEEKMEQYAAEFWAELASQNKRTQGISAEKVAQDESYWDCLKDSFAKFPNLINLNNGQVSPQPFVVQNAFIKAYRKSNEGSPYFLWQTLDSGRETRRDTLAKIADCSPEEIAFCRNTTEAMNTIIFGLDLKPGDEVVIAHKDYPNVITSWKQREKRDGIVLKWIDYQFPIEDDLFFLDKFQEQISERTKVFQVPHIINWNGQIQPLAKISDLAKKYGILTIADAAHSFAHIEYSISDLGCDFWGSSLHKWLCAPFGCGLLYVKRDQISKLWSCTPSFSYDDDNIRKFEAQGTRSLAAEIAIDEAIKFHQSIGGDRKEARFRYLKNYWAGQACLIDRVILHTSLLDQYSCGLALMNIEGIEPTEVVRILQDKFKIHVLAVEWNDLKGVRITPHLYNQLAELDRLSEGIEYISKM